MTKLGCDVSTCAYNCDRLCRRDSILIDGRRASQKEQTRCASFSAKQGVTNSTCCHTPKAATDISCKAVHCAFHCDGLCCAEEIRVSTCGCSDPCSPDETACTAFRSAR